MNQQQENSLENITADNFEDVGIMTASFDESFQVDIRALDKYCKSKGLRPEDMTDKEVAMFVLKD